MPPPVSRIPRSSLPAMPAAIVVLTTAAVLLGSRPWATPERVLGGWQVADRGRTPRECAQAYVHDVRRNFPGTRVFTQGSE